MILRILLLTSIAVSRLSAFYVDVDLDAFFDGAERLDGTSEAAAVDSKIVGGDQVDRYRYPYFVRLDKGGRIHCGGVFLHSDIVLTAAHCAYGDLKAVVNAFSIHDEFPDQEVRQVARIEKHPLYNAASKAFDVGLLKLEAPVTGIDVIQINALEAVPAIGDEMVTMGLGSTTEGGRSSNVLRHVPVKAIDVETCNAANAYDGHVISSIMFCAGAEGGGKDSCQGDSGGPLIETVAGEDELVGLVSWGQGCGRGSFPGVYTRISAVKEWIDETICDLSDFGCRVGPSNAGVECHDADDNGLFSVGSFAGPRTCSWLRTNPVFQETSCLAGEQAREMCPVTCGSCPEGSTIIYPSPISQMPTVSPTSSPTSGPTVTPTSPPTGHPTGSPTQSEKEPNRSPGFAIARPTPNRPTIPLFDNDRTGGRRPPSSWWASFGADDAATELNVQSHEYDDPTPLKCVDSLEEFFVAQIGRQHTCSWLERKAEWREELCRPSNEAYHMCEKTCEKCYDKCRDTRRRFVVDGAVRNCLWLSTHPRARQEVCKQDNVAWSACPSTCGACSRIRDSRRRGNEGAQQSSGLRGQR